MSDPTLDAYRNVTISEVTDSGDLVLQGEQRSRPDRSWIRFRGSLRMMMIRAVAHSGLTAAEEIWERSDGFGLLSAAETEYDWSGIRDSSPGAKARMYEVVLKGLSRAHFCDRLGIVDPCPPDVDLIYLTQAPEPESPGQPYVVSFRPNGSPGGFEQVAEDTAGDPRRPGDW